MVWLLNELSAGELCCAPSALKRRFRFSRAIRQPVVAAIATVSVEPHLFAPRALQTLNRAAIKASMSEDDDDDFSAFGQVGAAATATKMPDLGAADDDDEFR